MAKDIQLQRRHFEWLAEKLGGTIPIVADSPGFDSIDKKEVEQIAIRVWGKIVGVLAEDLKQTNPGFDKDKFIEAVKKETCF